MDRNRLLAGLVAAAMVVLPLRAAAQVTITPPMRLSEYLFWDTMGRSAGTAVRSYQDYTRERQMWKDRIEAAKRHMERCGGCPEAKAELAKWQGVENQFQEVAGTLARSVGMPPILAQALGIRMPMAASRPAADRPECKVNRPAWIDQAPADCKAAADGHISCLLNYQRANSNTCYWDRAEHPLAVCWDSLKLFEHCARQDYEGFARQKALHEMRAAGKVVPEYVPLGMDHYVLYGPVPDGFVPEIPAALVIADLDGPDRLHITFDMKKPKDGLLGRMIISLLDPMQVDAKDACLQLDLNKPGEELMRRQCLDLASLRRETQKNKMLRCEYTGQPRQLQTEHIYWYNERPQAAQAEYLLQRVRDHWLLRIGDPRTACPATLQEAVAIQNKYRSDVQTVAARTPQTPSSVVVPAPQWMLDEVAAYRKKRQVAMDKAFAEFKWAGIYKLDLRYAGGPPYPNTTCQITAAAAGRYDVKCSQVDYRGRTFHWPVAHGQLVDRKLVIEWEAGVTAAHEIALELDQGKSVLIYSRPRDAPPPRGKEVESSMLTRIGELPVDPNTIRPGQIVGSATNATGIWSGVIGCRSPAEVAQDPSRNVTSTHEVEIIVTLLDLTTAEELRDNHRRGVFGKVWGKLAFGPVNESQMPRGSLYVYGTRTRTSDIVLHAGAWIVQPPGFAALSATGFFIPANSTMSFQMLRGMGCSNNYFKRREIVADPGPMPDAIRSRLAGVGHPETYKPADPGAQSQQSPQVPQSPELPRPQAAAQPQGSQQTPQHSSGSAPALTGKWKGTYTCRLGLTNLELTLQDAGNGKIWGTFQFSAHPSNLSVATGKFYLHGRYDQRSKTIELSPTPDKWIARPPGYTAAAMKGTYSLDSGKMSGSILAAGCGSFEAAYAGKDTSDLGSMPDEVRATLR